MDPKDWDQFADLAIQDHRVAPVIAPMLKGLDMPDPVQDRLDKAIRGNAHKTLLQIAETRRVVSALKAIGAQPLIFKGWPLGVALYGDAGRRHAGDLDLLVPRAQVWDACAALEEAGYQPSENTAKMRRRARGMGNPQLIRALKDVELTNPQTGVAVELHWRLLSYDNWDGFLDHPGAEVCQDSQAGPIMVPDARANLMYLSAHGSLHLWDRLKWLADIAWLARARGMDALAQDLNHARHMGFARPVILALTLAGRLFGSPVPVGCDDPVALGLERWVLNRLGRPGARAADWRYQAGIRWMGLRLAADWRQVMGVVGYDTTRRLRLVSLDVGRN